MSAIAFIDSDDYAAAGIETMTFPGGEPHVKIPALSNPVLLYLKLRTWSDVGFGALVQDAIRNQNEALLRGSFIPYFPGARQDRSGGRAPITVNLIGRLFADTHVTVFDAHSDATEQSLKRFANILPHALDLSTRGEVAGVIAPDRGAAHRATDYCKCFCGLNKPVLICHKKRDAATGRLSDYEMPALPKAGRYIVVDDICDGGGTFNLLAEAWKKDPLAANSQLELFVSHGIFSKGLDAIDPVFEHITTTDSWCQRPSGPRLTVVRLLPQLLRLWR